MTSCVFTYVLFCQRGQVLKLSDHFCEIPKFQQKHVLFTILSMSPKYGNRQVELVIAYRLMLPDLSNNHQV